MTNIQKPVFLIAIILVFAFSNPMPIFASEASLSLSPSTGTYSVGRIFSVSIEIDSGGKAINAAEGSLKFNPDKLKIVSISKSGSIFSLWTKEPTFSNPSGTISFGGGTPDNFQGNSGIILTISFQAKTAGTCNVDFSSGSVLAADYKGTNILAGMVPGIYLIQPVKFPLPEYIPPEGAPKAPTISSPTHPDSEKWYSNDSPKFSWRVSPSITGVKLLADNNPVSIPTIFYPEAISEKQLENLEDGTWYFHAQLRNEFGWGGVSHFKFQIDTQPPAPFEITSKDGKTTTNPRPTIFFETTDEPSGIDYFEVQIDKESPIRLEEPEYQLSPHGIGKYLIIVKAVDKAGNSTLSMIFLSIIAPAFIRIGKVIIDYLTVTVTLLGLIVLLIGGSFWFWKKIQKRRKILRKEITETEKSLYEAFKKLEKEIEKQVAKLDKKPGLSAREKETSEDLKKALERSKELISKEIKDIEKELD